MRSGSLGRVSRAWEDTPVESTHPSPSAPTLDAVSEDAQLVTALRLGDERAFGEVVDRYSSSLLRLARDFVRTRSVAEEVVQETWLAVLQGIDRFEGRSSFKTWLFRILVNKAKTRGQREARTLPFSSFETGGEEPVVPEERFRAPDNQWAGHWASPPLPLRDVPEERLLSGELRSRLAEALQALPDTQRVVVTLRDVAGYDSEEVCELLAISEGNQRVLLHRGRSRLRSALEQYVVEGA
jgi:RNA polymerase sigma-70 factor (ECF subfamily)